MRKGDKVRAEEGAVLFERKASDGADESDRAEDADVNDACY